MFKYTAIVFFFALFSRAPCGSLAKPQNVADVLKPEDNHVDSTQAKLKEDTFLDEKVVQKNFEVIGSRFFYIETNVTLNWFSARNTCRQMGGKLATVRSEEELKLIVPKLKRDSAYWLDLNDLSEEGEFVSSGSYEPATFLNWRKGQPDNYNEREHCVQLINYYFYDCLCDDKQLFICES